MAYTGIELGPFADCDDHSPKPPRLTYRVEIFFGVARYIDGCRDTYVLEPQESEQRAREFAAELNRGAK